ncbi:MAG TPA: hypothetical protein VD794_01365, partial [Flavisolibacter sp.]|nr:hypothetical protein [Flavisolibacter sp.]
MRRYFLSLSMLMAVTFVFAQGQNASPTSFDFGHEKKATAASLTSLNNQPAVMVLLPYAPATVLSAMTEYEVNCYRPKKKQSTAYVAFDNTAIMKNNKT